jgi:hypothetical protein
MKDCGIGRVNFAARYFLLNQWKKRVGMVGIGTQQLGNACSSAAR